MTALFTAAENPARGSAVESLPQAGPVSPTSDPEGNPLMSESSMPRGPGLFEVTRSSGERVITNVRRLAGAERPPGSALVTTATILLGLLAVGLFAVSLAAQYRYVLNVKHDAPVSVIEAIAGLDAGMTIFSLLALGLARAGRSARIERALIVVCAVASAGMNYAAADDGSPRSVAAYCMPPVFLAVVVDRVVAVVRRHVLGDDERSAWAALGLAVLYALRCVLAPPSTAGGLRRWVLAATPLPAAERPAIEPPRPLAIQPPELAARARRHGSPGGTNRMPLSTGDRGQASAAASRIAPVVGRAPVPPGPTCTPSWPSWRRPRRHHDRRPGPGGPAHPSPGRPAYRPGAHRCRGALVPPGARPLRAGTAPCAGAALAGTAPVPAPGPGYASLAELVFRWGRLAALRHGRRARPGLRSLPADPACYGLRRSARPGSVFPPDVCPYGGSVPDPGAAAHGQVRRDR